MDNPYDFLKLPTDPLPCMKDVKRQYIKLSAGANDKYKAKLNIAYKKIKSGWKPPQKRAALDKPSVTRSDVKKVKIIAGDECIFVPLHKKCTKCHGSGKHANKINMGHYTINSEMTCYCDCDCDKGLVLDIEIINLENIAMLDKLMTYDDGQWKKITPIWPNDVSIFLYPNNMKNNMVKKILLPNGNVINHTVDFANTLGEYDIRYKFILPRKQI